MDATLTATAQFAVSVLAPIVWLAREGSPAVIYSTFAALALVIDYDTCRSIFPV